MCHELILSVTDIMALFCHIASVERELHTNNQPTLNASINLYIADPIRLSADELF